MKLLSRKLWIGIAVLLVLIVAAALALPALVDVNRYRATIEQHARQTLGREVRLGEMKLSLWPVFGVRVDDLAVGALPEEGSGDLLSAKSLRVGARLLPLLRKRLEVTSLVVQAPRLRLERGADGGWNVERLLAPGDGDGPGPATPGTPAFQVESLRITDGTILIRDAGAGRARPLEIGLEGLGLRLDGLSPDRPFELQLDTRLAGAPGARLRFEGRAGPLAPPVGQPTVVAGRLELRDVAPAALADVLAALMPLPDGLLGQRAFSTEARLDAAFGATSRTALSDVRVTGLELNLRRGKDGSWNLPSVPAGPEQDAAAGPAVELSGLELREATIRVRDASGAGEPLALALEQLSLTLDRLPGAAPARIDLGATLESGGQRGELAVRGRLGPRATGSEDLPAELSVSIDPIPAPLVRQALAGAIDLTGRSAGAALELQVAGALPGRPDVAGTFRVAGARVTLAAPDGSSRTMPLDLNARFDVAARDAGANLELRSLALETGGERLELKGTLREEGRLRRVDLTLAPTRISADRLAALLSLVASDLPFSFASPTPVDVQARVRGLYGEDRLPDLQGSAKLRDFTFRHALMDQPFEQVGADVVLEGQRVAITSLSGVVGGSDVAGRVTLEGFERPRVAFELRSQRADLGELFSFLRTDPATETTPDAAAAGPPDLLLDGTIRIASGTFQTLDFANLETRMRYESGVVTLDPVSVGLYEGTYRGTVAASFATPQPAFDIRGEAQGVNTDAFLTDNLGSPGLLTGSFSGRIETRGRGLDYESIVRGMQGQGGMEVREGRVGKLDVLKTLSKVSGLFGETTLKRISKRAATEGTEFSRLISGLRIEGGKLAFDGLLLESTEFELSGKGKLDLLTALLDGQFVLAFSPEISASMRAEGSRAAEAFWSSRAARVELPFSLSGPFSAPTPGVDLKAVARDAIRDRAKDSVRDELQKRLGIRPTPEPTPPAPGTPATPPPADELAPETAAPAPAAAGPAAEITTARWGGSVLARDLRLEGRVGGAGLTRASLLVRDARGIEVKRVDQLDELAAWLAAAADPAAEATVSWRLTLDGKKLLVAKFPLKVTLTVTDGAGRTAERVREVDR